MWINHLGEIMAGVFVLLILAHLGLHLWFKARRRKHRTKDGSS